MNESNSIETIDRTNSTERKTLSKLKNYFREEMNQRKACSKKLSKYVAAFDYIDKILIVLCATIGGVFIILFTSVVGAPVRIASASFTFIFSLTKRNKKSMKKFLCWLKVNSIALKHGNKS